MSIAGHLNKKKSKEGTLREIGLTYEYGKLETLAFHYLIGSSNFFQGGNLDDLRHYTLMRLYSADKTCRNDPDYVSFFILRLAAFGCGRAKKVVSKWPASSQFHEGFKDEICIHLLSEIHA